MATRSNLHFASTTTEPKKKRSARKLAKKQFNNLLDMYDNKTPFDPSLLSSIPLEVFETHTSDEDNIKEPELYEGGDPWGYVAPVTVEDKIDEKYHIDSILHVLNQNERKFKASINKNIPSTSEQPVETKEKTKPVKRRKTESVTPTLSMFEFKKVPDELADYINGSISGLSNFGSNNTFECNKSFNKHKSDILHFIEYSHEHLIQMLPDERNEQTNSQNDLNFFSTTENQPEEELQPDFNTSIITKSDGTGLDEFCILLDHSYIGTSQFNLIQFILSPLLNITNAENSDGLELNLQSNKVIKRETFFIERQEGSEEEKKNKRVVWENVVYWLSRDDDPNSFQYDMFLVIFIKYTIMLKNDSKGASETNKVIKAYMFLRCKP